MSQNLLTYVPSPYGAQLGRRNFTEQTNVKVRLFKIELNGDYDKGGVYWGHTPGTQMYAAIGEGFEWYHRVENGRAEAKELLQKEFPDLKFYR